MAFYNSIPVAAKWLDSVEPEWYKKVDKTTLDMGSSHRCVLAQVFGTYFIAQNKYKIPPYTKAFGDGASDKDWIEEINSRLSPKLTPLQQAEKNIADLEAKLQEEKAKLEALRNPQISVTMTQSQWKFVASFLNGNGYDYPEITKAANGE